MVAFSPGTAVDLAARALAQDLSARLGQPVIVENRPGSGGVLGSVTVAKAPADGYTLLMTGIGPAVLRPLIDTAVNYDPKYAEALNGRCITKAIVGRAKDGLADCEASLKLKPNDPYALDSRAFCQLKLGEYDAAIAGFNEALAVKPELANSLYGRGIAESRSGDFERAHKDIAAARAINADIADEFERYGVAKVE